MNKRDALRQIPAFATLMAEADVIDIKTTASDVTLRQFVAGLMSYQPAWVTFLYRIRAVLVRVLGMKQERLPQAQQWSPDDVAMTPGEPAYLFTVHAAEPDRYWIAEIKDRHLDAYLGVMVERHDERQRFFVVTIVHHNSWQGPIYYNVIRPFHHLVVGAMMRHAGKPHPETTLTTETQ